MAGSPFVAVAAMVVALAVAVVASTAIAQQDHPMGFFITSVGLGDGANLGHSAETRAVCGLDDLQRDRRIGLDDRGDARGVAYGDFNQDGWTDISQRIRDRVVEKVTGGAALTPELANEAIKCLDAGATIVHAHSDKPSDNVTKAVQAYVDAFTPVREKHPLGVIYPTANFDPKVYHEQRKVWPGAIQSGHYRPIAKAGLANMVLLDTGVVHLADDVHHRIDLVACRGFVRGDRARQIDRRLCLERDAAVVLLPYDHRRKQIHLQPSLVAYEVVIDKEDAAVIATIV